MSPALNQKRKNVHYEVQALVGRTWTILQVCDTESEAKTFTEDRWKTGAYKAMKVLRERYERDQGEFNSLEILYKGRKRKASKHDDDDIQLRPCVKEDDLYSPDARRTINRFLKELFHRDGACATEILHDFEYYLKVDNSSTAIQAAVQKASIVLVRETGEQIQSRMKKLFDLIGRAGVQLKEARDQGRIPEGLTSDSFQDWVDKLDPVLGRSFRMTAGLVVACRSLGSAQEKITFLVGLLEQDPPGFALDAIDQYASELMDHPGVMSVILEAPASAEERWVRLVRFARGQFDEAQTPLAIAMNQGFAKSRLPKCRQVLLRQLGEDVRSNKRLTGSGSSILDEFKALSRVVDSLDEDRNLMLGEETIFEIMEERQARSLNSETVGALIQGAETPAVSLERLIALEKHVLGVKNHRALANYVLPVLSSPEHEGFFRGRDGKIMERLHQLVQLQRAFLKSEFQEMHKRKIAEYLDDHAVYILRHSEFFKRLRASAKPSNQKGRQLLSLIVDGYFTEGMAVDVAREEARHYLKQPGFMEEFMNSFAEGERARELLKFRNMLMEAQVGPVEPTPPAKPVPPQPTED